MPPAVTLDYYNWDYKHIISNCENDLDIGDAVSIVFLMCEDTVLALSILFKNLNMSLQAKDMLRELFLSLSQCSCQNIRTKFIESLALTGNFSSLVKLGFSLKESKSLKENCCQEFSLTCVNTLRKELFLMMNKMGDEELNHMIDLINDDFRLNNCYFLDKRYRYAEVHILYFLSLDYFSDGFRNSCDLSKLIEVLNVLKKKDLIKRLVNVSNECSSVTDNDIHHSLVCAARNSSICYPTNYPMCEDKGLCVIVNQRNFERASNVQLSFRHGTDSDRDLLQLTFSALGYKVKIMENLSSHDFEKDIKLTLKKEVLREHSSFVLCILSHGKEGAVYCTDGRDISVRRIEGWIVGYECPQLISKPKVLILQACQGSTKQRGLPVPPPCLDQSDVETDGLAGVSAPLADLLVFHSTVPGYASFRNLAEGSPFIKTLCLQLLNYAVVDVHDVFIEVSNYLNSRPILGYVTTPEVKHTLTKKIKFGVSETNRTKTACKLFEKYLVDKLFQEYTVYILKRLDSA